MKTGASIFVSVSSAVLSTVSSGDSSTDISVSSETSTDREAHPMNKIIRRYVPFMKAGVQNLVVYRLNFLGFVIGGLIYCFVMFYLWKAVFESNGVGMFLGFLPKNNIFWYINRSFSKHRTHNCTRRTNRHISKINRIISCNTT